MRVTYYGQACTLIEAAGRKILTDPWLTEGAYLGTWHHTHLLADAGVTPAAFPKDVDYLFLSHEHEDHLDAETLAHFPPDVPVLICRFPTPKFRRHLESLGLRRITEVASGMPLDLGDGLEVTIFGSAEYTNDSALLVRAEGYTVFNETDCKLPYADLARLGEQGIDLGFYMFSGANWYPMLYEAPDDLLRERVRRRRRALVRGFVERVRVTRPRIAVPAAGPCTVLDPDLLWLNSAERGIFIDPVEAVDAAAAAGLASPVVYMAATDAWDSRTGIEANAPAAFRLPRDRYIADAAARMAGTIAARKAAEQPAGSDLPSRLVAFFEERVAAQTASMRARIGARVALEVAGPAGGSWTVDFTSA
ncbi:MAG TPA: MBL fold metallo-hydrolase, partial [Vicinamibacterales bacterium]|nr:MBL fold metallo-hydrolase [Vicinamibacterales bacterium]